MPKINVDYKNKKGRIVYDVEDWISGMNQEGSTITMNGRSLILDGVYGMVNPFKYIGALRPCFGAANLTNHATVTARVMGSIDDGNYIYGICSDAKIQRSSRVGVIATSSWPHTITAHGGHSTPVGEDIVIYNQAGTDYAFYSWSDNTDGDVGRFDLSSTFDDDYMSTVAGGGAVLATKYYHPMVVGENGKLYIGDGNNLHELSNATYTQNKFVLPTGYIITSFAKWDTYLVIYAHKITKNATRFTGATAFFWDMASPLADLKILLEDDQVNGGFTFQGIPGCITSAIKEVMSESSNVMKLRMFDGRRFKIIEMVKDTTMPIKNGVVTTESGVYFHPALSTACRIYYWGSPSPSIPPTLLKISQSSHLSEYPGALTHFSVGASANLWSSTGGDVNGNRWQTHNSVAGGANCYLLSAFPNLNKRDKMLISNVTVKFFRSSDATGGSLQLELFIDGLTLKTVFTELQTVANNEIKEYGFLSDNSVFGTADQSIGAVLTWSNYTSHFIYPYVKEIIIDFDII